MGFPNEVYDNKWAIIFICRQEVVNSVSQEVVTYKPSSLHCKLLPSPSPLPIAIATDYVCLPPCSALRLPIFHLPQLQTQLVALFPGLQTGQTAVGVLSVMVAVNTCVWTLREVLAVSVDQGINWLMESTA